MRTTKTVTLLSLLTALLMLIATVAQATSPQPLPVRERLEGSLAAIPVPAPEDRCSQPALLLQYAGEGTLSHVGKVAFTSTHCSYLTAEGQPSGRYGEAVLVMVGPRGDEIHATYEGRPLDATHYLEIMEITGGTGRFAQATGEIVEIVTLDMTTFGVSVRGWGWIVY